MRRDIIDSPRIDRRFNTVMARVVPCVVAAGAMLLVWQNASKAPATASSTRAVAQPEGLPMPVLLGAPSSNPPESARATSGASTVRVIVGRNDTLDAIFRRMALDKADLAAIRSLPGVRQSLDLLKPGDAIDVTRSAGDLTALTRQVNETQTLRIVRKDDGFAASMQSQPVDTQLRTASATIDSSLFQAAADARISDAVAVKLASMFAWDIDFVLDIRQGDHFKAVYERIFKDGKYLRDGEVLAAEFVNNGKTYRALRFADDDGKAGYYSPDGRPLRKAFLRAPVDFTRVSSGFNPARKHPILNLIRGHMGTDYAAPQGTPIHAAGDGRVSFEGRRGGYGNAIMLAHVDNISTLYGHMSRFARNLHVGSHVQQGEVIGYVGMTGLATGPHLHYEYLLNGVHKDPQTVQLAGAEPLNSESLARFRAATAPALMELLAPAPAPAPGPPSGNTPVGDERHGQ